jgi:hypothetical protein
MNTTDRSRRLATMTSVFRKSTRFRFWLVPVLIVVILLAGWWIRVTLAESVKGQLEGELQAILDADVAALDTWLRAQEASVSFLGWSKRVGRLVSRLERAHLEDGAGPEELAGMPGQQELREILDPLMADLGYAGYVVIDQSGTVFAASRDEPVGDVVSQDGMRLLAPVMVGESIVTRPFIPIISIPDRDLGVRDGLPTMVVAGPVRDEARRIIAALAAVIRPEDDFTRILNVARIGESGETYAFDADGLMLSYSRFDEELHAIGLLPEDESVDSQLNIAIRDPGGNLVEGFVPEVDRDAQPLTRMAASAVTGQSGVDVDGYRDYRGVNVLGAWTWLPRYGFGVATEIDQDEAMAMPGQLRRILWAVIGLLVLGAGLVVGGSTFIARLGRKMDRAVMEARTLGQYTLESKIGAGGMGEVYRARHAMLRRPTAVKLLHPGKAGDDAIKRFEREVQMTSRLTHPNTVAVYDYGRTPDGIFYYAMEYLPGVNLAGLVKIDGTQPEGRVIHILRQVCGSLDEAHAHGLIHRDIKPENVILCERGGVYDVAKVLDFGIVKDVGEGSAKLTMDGSLSGTPHYIPPETFRDAGDVDARADLYAVGAVGYFLLTGGPVFEGDNPMEICTKHLNEIPVPVSERADGPVSPDLEAVIMSCLEKTPLLRPASARELSERLAACSAAGSWTVEDARSWWSEHPDLLPDAGGEVTSPDVTGGGEHTATVVMTGEDD